MTNLHQKVPENWFADWFDDLYLKVYSHRDLSEAKQFLSNWQIWSSIDKRGLCLDLGCGSGRYTYELAKRGLNVIALDLSIPLLEMAAKENSHPEQVLFVRGDMRSVPVRSGFSLIVSLFTSFGYFNDSENLKLIQTVGKLLKPEGLFVLDVPNPQAVRRNVRNNRISIRIENDMHIREERYLDDDKKRVAKLIKLDFQGESKKYYESIRLYESEELNMMLEECGLETKYPVQGDYNGEEFKIESPRMIYFSGIK